MSPTTTAPVGRICGVVVAVALAALVSPMAGGPAHAEPAWRDEPERSVEGEVQVSLTPREVSDGRFRVDISLTTHSGDLGELDLAAATVLIAGGQSVRPVKAPKLRGHHARGRLEFPLERVPESFQIVIRDVRSQGDLIFRWP